MSVPAENYTFGFNFIFAVLAMIPTIPILIYVIVPTFYDTNIVNCYEVCTDIYLSIIYQQSNVMYLFYLFEKYLEMRFNRRTRQFVTMTFILNQFLMLPVYMFIPSLAFSQGKNI